MNGSENTPEIIAKRAQEYLLDVERTISSWCKAVEDGASPQQKDVNDIIRYTAIASALRYVLTGSTTR